MELGRLCEEKVQGNNQLKKHDVVDDEKERPYYKEDIEEIKCDCVLYERKKRTISGNVDVINKLVLVNDKGYIIQANIMSYQLYM